MGKRSAVVELFLGDMGSIQRETRPSMQREDQLTMETKLEQIAPAHPRARAPLPLNCPEQTFTRPFSNRCSRPILLKNSVAASERLSMENDNSKEMPGTKQNFSLVILGH